MIFSGISKAGSKIKVKNEIIYFLLFIIDLKRAINSNYSLIVNLRVF